MLGVVSLFGRKDNLRLMSMSIVQGGVVGHSCLIKSENLKLESRSSVLMPWWMSRLFWARLADRSMMFFFLMRLRGGV